MCFFFYSKLWTFRKKNQWQKKCTSFLHEPCVLPAPLPSPSPHFSSTDRNLTVANLHVLATQINVAFLLISFVGIGESPGPYSLPPMGYLWDWGLPCATRARSPTLGVQEPAHLYHSRPSCQHRAPPLPARAPRAGRVTLFLSNRKSHQLPNCVPLSKDMCRLATVAFCDCLVLKEQVHPRVRPVVHHLHRLLLERALLLPDEEMCTGLLGVSTRGAMSVFL